MSNVDPHSIEELVNGLIDGELTATEEAEVRQRLDQDKDLAARLQEIMRVGRW
jgi:anti-sigma factor RsiW